MKLRVFAWLMEPLVIGFLYSQVVLAAQSLVVCGIAGCSLVSPQINVTGGKDSFFLRSEVINDNNIDMYSYL